MFKKTILKNKLRIITIPIKSTQAVTVLVLAKTGSKYENKDISGISHFLEHMFFKGTKKREDKMEIAETLDRVGGMYNAFTGKEYTGYYAKVSQKHFNLALDWVSDIFLNSKIEQKEINNERGVIIEEMNMYFDTPMMYIGDLWEQLLYGDQPAGWPILGGKDNILKFQRKDFLNYFKNHYTAKNTIVCVAGDIKSKDVENKVRQYFKNIETADSKPKLKVVERQSQPESLISFKQTDQTHLILGARGYDAFNNNKYTQSLLSIILGGFMSSRLFMSIRENKGLAYYIKTSSETNTDTGFLATAAGIRNEKVEEAVSLILKEYKLMKNKKIDKKELQKAKDYLKGISSLSLESSDAQASFYATQELLTGEIVSLKEKHKRIDAVTQYDILKVAKEIFVPEKLNLALIGPFKNKNKFQKILKI